MFSLAVSGLALSSTYSQVETLRRDARSLSVAISGLATSSGRAFSNPFEDIISDGKLQKSVIIYFVSQEMLKGFPRCFTVCKVASADIF